jgi:hypothetical protein
VVSVSAAAVAAAAPTEVVRRARRRSAFSRFDRCRTVCVLARLPRAVTIER